MKAMRASAVLAVVFAAAWLLLPRDAAAPPRRGAPPPRPIPAELGELELRTVDQETGREVFVAYVAWTAPSAESPVDGRPLLRREAARHLIRAPVGGIRLHLRDPIWHTEAVTQRVFPGRREATVPVERTCWARLVFLEHQTPVSDYVILEVASGPGALLESARKDRGDGIVYGFTRPGRYQLVIPDYNGFQPTTPLIVDVSRHGVAERTFQVMRTR
jgi:hypothetical protein